MLSISHCSFTDCTRYIVNMFTHIDIYTPHGDSLPSCARWFKHSSYSTMDKFSTTDMYTNRWHLSTCTCITSLQGLSIIWTHFSSSLVHDYIQRYTFMFVQMSLLVYWCNKLTKNDDYLSDKSYAPTCQYKPNILCCWLLRNYKANV